MSLVRLRVDIKDLKLIALGRPKAEDSSEFLIELFMQIRILVIL